MRILAYDAGMPELIDVLTADGAPTGARKEKSGVHRDGDWHRAAHVWIVTPAKLVLLQRRALIKENWPGLWDLSVAGHVSAGESAIDAALRETREEIGLELHPDELIPLGTVREQWVLNGGAYVDNEIHEIFVVRRDINLAALRLDPDEVAEVALAEPGDLGRYALVPHPEEYARLGSYLQTC